jgi:nitrogen fixation protein FixH
MSPPNSDHQTWPRLTGGMVLLYLLTFFGVVSAVNGVMIYEALSTMRGVDTESAYQAGRMFEQDVAMLKAQDARHWQIDAKLTPALNGTRLELAARDQAGHVLTGMAASANFERPTDRGLDRKVALTEDLPGQYHGTTELIPGQWDLVIEVSRQGQQLFRSKNRVVLR